MPKLSDIRQVLISHSNDNAKIFDLMCDLGQEKLFENWDPSDISERHLDLLKQISDCDQQYPGGLRQYIENAQKLLLSSKNGENPYEGFVPKVPHGKNMIFADEFFRKMENLGLEKATRTGFVLVAGGLGERLGYSGIKIALPSETTTGKPFIQLYIETLLAFQKKANARLAENRKIPLAIMTSGDTHDRTEALLEANRNFGMEKGQITLMKQEKVPSLCNNQAQFVTGEENPFELETKPHGHGDVHVLLHQKGIAQKWLEDGIEWMNFFQDTNGVIFKAILPALGVSISEDFEVNTITVPRKAGEAAGGIVRLEKSNGEGMTINVEYNQLDPLLKANGQPEGDVADETGYSPFPGNTNVLLFKLKPYVENLDKSGGMIPEFVNPKYADASKEVFKKPTRLECMMQDYPKLLGPEAKVGFTNFERWVCFSAVKNNIVDAAAKAEKGLPAECAGTGEMDVYHVHRESLRTCGAKFEEQRETIAGIPLVTGPRVVLAPEFACTLDELQSKVKGLQLAPNSTLVVEGDVEITNVSVDGTLIVRNSLSNCDVKNAGWKIEALSPDEEVSEELAIRGFRIKKLEQEEV